MTKNQQLIAIRAFAQSFHQTDATGHDWFHISRVVNVAKKIAEAEHADVVKVEIVALLHDIADYKMNNGDESIGFEKITRFLLSLAFTPEEINEIITDIKNISFKGGNNVVSDQSITSKIVQDADRIDAIGAIGVARTFAYGGSKKRMMYDPEIKPQLHQTAEEYKNSTAPTINHFYEKLLLLKDKMNTQTAKQIAEQRHLFLEYFLTQFFNEWEGKV
ncbi:MAG: HD domain-containing protein [Flavobacteriales bacterium]